MVSVTHTAGEMGTVQPIAEIAKGVKRLQQKCRMHTDAVQALPQLGHLAICPEVDMVTVSAHKIGGPQGVGALLVRPNALPRPLLFGGDQQQAVRPGTFNLPGIAGFGEAARIFAEERDAGIHAMRTLCNRLILEIVSRVEGASLLGDPSSRAPGIAVIAFDNMESEVLLHALENLGVLASSSSACHSARKDPPRCLVHAGLRHGQGAVRFSLSTKTTPQDIDGAVAAVSQAVSAFRRGRFGDL
jgi:cysteine desulfurase